MQSEPTTNELLDLLRQAQALLTSESVEARQWHYRASRLLKPPQDPPPVDDSCTCPRCGSASLWYQEYVPSIRELIDIRDGVVWIDEDEEQCWETSFGGCLSCSTCSAEFPLPKGHEFEWTSADYFRRYGHQALAAARARGRRAPASAGEHRQPTD
ncbi:MAG: hypothetical protein ACE37F_04125 [Nannocystaceae bacterium]|nr:hypothetical protein [bacterium]